MASASSSHHPDSVANIRIFPDHFAHTISPACDVLDEFIKLLETPRDHDEQAGIAISIHRGDRIDALRLHLTRLKADLERIREGTLSLSISVNNALGITTNRSFAASSFEHQPHANLQRIYHVKIGGRDDDETLGDYLQKVVEHCCDVMDERRVDLDKFPAAADGAEKWDTLSYLTKSKAVVDAVKGLHETLPRQRLHRWLHRAFQVVEGFLPGGRLDRMLNEVTSAAHHPGPGSFESHRENQHRLAREARNTFQRLELDLLNHARPVSFTTIQHTLNWLGVYTFKDKAFPYWPLDLKMLMDHVMGLHTVDPSDPESERHVLGYFSGFREALRKLVNADRAMRTPAEPAIDQKTSEKPELEHWTRDVWSVLFQDDHFRKSDKARIEKIHGFLEDLKTHHLCPAVDTLKDLQHKAYGDGRDAMEDTAAAMAELQGTRTPTEEEKAQAQRDWPTFSSAERLRVVIRAYHALHGPRLAPPHQPHAHHLHSPHEPALTLGKSPMISARRSRSYGVTNAELERRWGAAAS